MVPYEQELSSGSSSSQQAPPPVSQQPETARMSEEAARAAEHGRAALEEVGRILTRPGVGASIAGGMVLGAAVLFGIPEAIVGAGAAYVAYRVLKKRKQRE